MRRLFILTAAVLAAVVVFGLVTLPPPAATTHGTVDPALARRTWAGAFHVHSSRSDGAESKSAIAAAAAKAGLRFVMFTEHGDGTTPREPPAYVDGVLCIDGVEISTTGGHYVALDLPATPYRLGGDAAGVVEDVRRFGGFGIAAHPDSRKTELAWADWSLPIDGLEWLNADSEWRDESRTRLARTLLAYFVRPGPALASLLDRPSSTLGRWDELAARRVVGIAGHDAHGSIAGRQEGSALTLGGIPSYEAAFRSFSVRAILGSEGTGDATADARRVIDAIRGGTTFTAIDAIAAPALLDFRARRGDELVGMGQSIHAGEGTVTFTIQATRPDGGTIALLRNGVQIAQEQQETMSVPVAESGAYRIEIYTPFAPGTPPIPWVVSNPIYVGVASPPPAIAPRPVSLVTLGALDWRIEKSPSSAGDILKGRDEVRLEYRLAGGAEDSPYVALVGDLAGVPPDANALVLRVRSSKPNRVLVQLRSAARGGARLATSVFASPQTDEIVLPLSVFRPADRDPTRFELREASSLLVVVDLTNHAAGASGDIEVSGVRLARVAAPVR